LHEETFDVIDECGLKKFAAAQVVEVLLIVNNPQSKSLLKNKIGLRKGVRGESSPPKTIKPLTVLGQWLLLFGRLTRGFSAERMPCSGARE
jgi:hypothetical protein